MFYASFYNLIEVYAFHNFNLSRSEIHIDIECLMSVNDMCFEWEISLGLV